MTILHTLFERSVANPSESWIWASPEEIAEYVHALGGDQEPPLAPIFCGPQGGPLFQGRELRVSE